MARKLHTFPQQAGNGPFNENQLRWFRFMERSNGAITHGVFVKLGRRVYIDPDAMDRWIDAMQATQAVRA